MGWMQRERLRGYDYYGLEWNVDVGSLTRGYKGPR